MRRTAAEARCVSGVAGSVRDASFRDIVIRDTRTAVDVVSSWRRGGTGVMFQDIEFDGLDVDSVLLCRVSPSFAKETRIDGIRFANAKGRVECPSWITGRQDSPVGCVAFDNVSLRHGVVCLNAPEVRIVGGNFARIEPTELERLTWNRKIDERDEFPCVFSGPLYDSIQSRRLRFGE